MSGNTFSGAFNPEFSPKVKLSTHSVAFPPLAPGQAGHQTAAIINYGDTPVGARKSSSAGTVRGAGASGPRRARPTAATLTRGPVTNAQQSHKQTLLPG